MSDSVSRYLVRLIRRDILGCQESDRTWLAPAVRSSCVTRYADIDHLLDAVCEMSRERGGAQTMRRCIRQTKLPTKSRLSSWRFIFGRPTGLQVHRPVEIVNRRVVRPSRNTHNHTHCNCTIAWKAFKQTVYNSLNILLRTAELRLFEDTIFILHFSIYYVLVCASFEPYSIELGIDIGLHKVIARATYHLIVQNTRTSKTIPSLSGSINPLQSNFA